MTHNPNPAKVLLGIDIGTTSISAALIDYETGRALETHAIANTSKLPSENDFSELDAPWIAEQIEQLVERLSQAYPNIRCIGVTGQMHGMLYLSEDGRAVSPLYNWQDGRGNRLFSENRTYCEEIKSRTGFDCYSGYAFATLFYNRLNGLEPKEAHSFCSIMDYVVMVLTNEKKPLIHASNAASFGLYDLKNNVFDESAVAKLGLSRYELPQITKNQGIAGYRGDVPVCVAIGDNQASFFGSIKDETNSALVNFGTGSQVSMVVEQVETTLPELEVRPYLFGKFLVCGSALCGGKAYAVLERFFAEYMQFATQETHSQYETMNALAQKAYADGRPLSVSPLFCGTRQSPSLRGSISGIDDTNFTPGNLILGVLSGMAKELKSHFDQMNPEAVSHLVASGNAVKKNPVLPLLLRDVFQINVTLTDNEEEAAIGCALYAGVVSSVIPLSRSKEIIKEKKNEQR